MILSVFNEKDDLILKQWKKMILLESNVKKDFTSLNY